MFAWDGATASYPISCLASKIVTLSPSPAASLPLLFIVRRDLTIEPLERWDLSSLALEYSILIFMSRDPLSWWFHIDAQSALSLKNDKGLALSLKNDKGSVHGS